MLVNDIESDDNLAVLVRLVKFRSKDAFQLLQIKEGSCKYVEHLVLAGTRRQAGLAKVDDGFSIRNMMRRLLVHAAAASWNLN